MFDLSEHLPEQLDLIGGVRTPPSGLSGVELADPNTRLLLAKGRATTVDSVERALVAADRAHRHGHWADLPIEERARRLEFFGAALRARSGSLGIPESINTGVPIGVTESIASGVAGFFDGLAQWIRAAGEMKESQGHHGRVQQHRLPWGPTIILAPWNAPMPTIIGKTAMALAAGCPVIVKPSEWAPLTANIVADAAEEAELPPGVFQLVHGGAAVGAQLVADKRVRVVVFTGGLEAGRSIARSAAPNFPVLQLELGGTNPAIIRADADLEATATSLAAGITRLNGQWCESPGRLLVHESLAGDLLDAVSIRLATMSIGSSLSAETQIGPLSHGAHLEKVRASLREYESKGGALHASCEVPDLDGWFLSPTLVTGISAEQTLLEVFGPVASIHTFSTDEEALKLANLGRDGLAGYVFTSDIDVALELGSRIHAGEVRINGTGLFDLCDGSSQSFWGDSGIGGHVADLPELFRGHRIVGEDDPAS